MIRLILALCLGLAFAAPAAAVDLQNLSPADKAAIAAEIRSYLIAHPEVLMEALQALDAKRAAQKAEADKSLVKANAEALFHDAASWVGGNPDGNVTMVEFMDYRCPYCRQAYEDVNQLVKSDGNIRFIVKEFPILGPQSELSARFAIAVLQTAGPEAYAKIHDALMRHRGQITPAALTALAQKGGLDAKALLKRMKSEAVSRVIADNLALGTKLAVEGTPTFVIADQLVRGYMPLAGMQQIVDKARRE
jgi:protein-disulfide isomerase